MKGFSNTQFVLLENTSGQYLSKIEQYLGEQGPKRTKKGPFHSLHVESIQKTVKIFNFITRNSILMELATDISTALSFGEILGLINHKVQEGINKKTRKISQKDFGPNFDHFLILQ